MSNPAYRFELTLDTDPQTPTLKVLDVTDPTTTPSYGPMALPLGGPPYSLVLGPAADASAALTIRPAASDSDGLVFDPAVTSGRSVLSLRSFITDLRFNSRDDTHYVLRLSNESKYYLAEDIRITASLTEPDPKNPILLLPDGNAALELVPNEQHLSCVEPGHERDVVFAVISRGVRPDLYPIEIAMAYRIVYWDGHETRTRYHQLLPVQGDELRFHLSTGETPAYLPRQPSTVSSNAKRNAMQSEQNATAFVAPIHSHRPRHRVLRHVERHIELPGGGHLDIGYRLVKGQHADPEKCNCCYGVNPESSELESYFSTQDTAALELRLHNHSNHHLKHVRVANVRLFRMGENHFPGAPVNQKLPDGNSIFEIVPDEVYFGHLLPEHPEHKYLSLITRGVEEGHYCVQLDIRYDIEQCTVTVDLPLTVQPD